MKNHATILLLALLPLAGCVSRQAALDTTISPEQPPAKPEWAKRREAQSARDRLKRIEYALAHPERPQEIRDALKEGTFAIGMTREELRMAIPSVSVLARHSGGSEQWMWHNGTKTYYLYLANGELKSWSETRRFDY